MASAIVPAGSAFVERQWIWFRRKELTDLGRRTAVLFAKAYERVLAPGLTALDTRLPQDVAGRHPVTLAWRRLDRALDDFMESRLSAA